MAFCLVYINHVATFARCICAYLHPSDERTFKPVDPTGGRGGFEDETTLVHTGAGMGWQGKMDGSGLNLWSFGQCNQCYQCNASVWWVMCFYVFFGSLPQLLFCSDMFISTSMGHQVVPRHPGDPDLTRSSLPGESFHVETPDAHGCPKSATRTWGGPMGPMGPEMPWVAQVSRVTVHFSMIAIMAFLVNFYRSLAKISPKDWYPWTFGPT